jgi:hypothetical protein
MTHRSIVQPWFFSVLVAAACSATPPSDSDGVDPLGNAGGSVGGGKGGDSPGASGSGSEPMTTSSDASSSEPTTSPSNEAGTVTAIDGSSGSLVDAGARPSNFVCSQVLGLLTTNEWYSQGFEMGGVDPAKWQIKYQHYGYVREWANPDSTFWNAPISSACKENSTSPDRVVFAALDWEMLTEDEWVNALTAAVNTIKLKYPGLRWLDLTTLIRCPGNQMCNPKAKYGPGANMSASIQDCYVPPYEDSAIAKVAAAHPDFVGVGPKVEASMCRSPVDGAHLSQASNAKAAQDMAAYYKNLP